MGIQDWSEDIILVDLPKEPEIDEQLKTVLEMVRYRGDCEVAIDFSGVDILTSSSFLKLCKLRDLLTQNGHHLVLFCVGTVTRGLFKVTGLEETFVFFDDRDAAMKSLTWVS